MQCAVVLKKLLEILEFSAVVTSIATAHCAVAMDVTTADICDQCSSVDVTTGKDCLLCSSGESLTAT